MENKEIFLRLLRNAAGQRQGIENLIAWLCSSDFFTAPASSRFHSSYPGGLCEHCMKVYNRLQLLLQSVPDAPTVSAESVAIVALLHDVCKANYYGVEMRNRKNDAGQWEKYPFYIVDEKFPFGHGEKSVFLIERYIRLTPEEAVAIRFHMGAFDDGSRSVYGAACEKYSLALYLHTADMMASHFDETTEEEK